jgi:ankyrin repeat protein
MARPGRSRKHGLSADTIRQAITDDTDAAIALLEDIGIDSLDGDARTPLMWAAVENKHEVLSWLLAQGAAVDAQDNNGHTALHFAVQENNPEIVLALLSHGACVDAKDIHGNTPLWRAAFNAHEDYRLVKILVSHGADPNLRNNSGYSPLDLASQFGDEQLLTVLKGG